MLRNSEWQTTKAAAAKKAIEVLRRMHGGDIVAHYNCSSSPVMCRACGLCAPLSFLIPKRDVRLPYNAYAWGRCPQNFHRADRIHDHLLRWARSVVKTPHVATQHAFVEYSSLRIVMCRKCGLWANHIGPHVKSVGFVLG